MRPVVFACSVLLTGLLCAGTSSSPVQFEDIAAASGLTAQNTYGGLLRKDFILETTGNGVAVFDYDGDGRDDVLLVNGTRLKPDAGTAPGSKTQSLTLYHNEGKGRFRDVSAGAGFGPAAWYQGVCVGDYDNDGHPDLLVTAYGQNRLYRNKGGGEFEDRTAKANLPTTGIRYGSGCSFVDYDRDGFLDFFVANYVDLDLTKTPHPGSDGFCQWKGIAVMCGPRGLPLAHMALYHNNRDGTFTDVSQKSQIDKAGPRYGLGVVAADFDNDGWPDIYVACDMTPSLFFHNKGDGTFEERGAEAGVAFNFDGSLQAGMGVSVADYDGDGRPDIAKTNFSGDLPSLFHNDDGKFFTDLSREAGLGTRQLLGWGISFLDVDDDGWPDLVIANGHVYPEVEGKQLGDTYLQQTLLYRNDGKGKFQDCTKEAGPAFQVGRPGRGLAVGDLDEDGRPEIVILNMNATPSLLKNRASGSNHFLNLTLTGTKSNRSAIGAIVRLKTADGHTQSQTVGSGGSYYSQSSFTLHFGLGNALKVDTVEIHWPAGGVQNLGPQAADQRLKVAEP